MFLKRINLYLLGGVVNKAILQKHSIVCHLIANQIHSVEYFFGIRVINDVSNAKFSFDFLTSKLFIKQKKSDINSSLRNVRLLEKTYYISFLGSCNGFLFYLVDIFP